jgi:hypothetical protein
MKEIQNILDALLPFIENLLKEYGEFYPVATALNNDGELIHLDTFEGDDNPESENVIDYSKKELLSMRNSIQACCIFYDVHLGDENTDAVAVLVESKTENLSFMFYQPYDIDQGKVVFGVPWKVEKAPEIF